MSFIDRLMDQIDPHQPYHDERLLHARRACGRWIALRRAGQDLTSPQLAARVGVSIDALRQLEAGLADAALLPEDMPRRLADALAQPGADARRVASVAAIAAGYPDALAPQVVEQVLDDLERDVADKARQDGMVVDKPIVVVEVALPEITKQKELLRNNPVALLVLQLIEAGEQSLVALWEAIDPKRSADLLVQIGGALEALRVSGLADKSQVRLDQKYGNAPVQHYRITEAGRHALKEVPIPSDAPLGVLKRRLVPGPG
jgi:hypothetical protein